MNEKQSALIRLLERKRSADKGELKEMLAEYGDESMVTPDDIAMVDGNIDAAINHVSNADDPFAIGIRGNEYVFPHRDWVDAIFSTMANDNVWLGQFTENCDRAFWGELSNPVCLSEYAK